MKVHTKKIGFILLLFITAQTYGQINTGLRFVMEGGSSITTLKQKQGSIYTNLSVSGLPTAKIWDKFQPSANFGVILGSIGWQFNPWVFLGIGTGLKYYYDQSDGDLPVFTDLRFNFLNRKVSPTLSFKGGYNLADNLFGDISAGICYSILPKTSLLLNLAITNYRFESTLTTPAGFSDKYPYSYDPGKIENIAIKNFLLQFRTGLIF